ncbi:MAG: cobalt-precorrin-6A reductase [Chloroflexota bacterium]
MSLERHAGPVLVLGGTTEARELALLLERAGIPCVSSLAGRLAQPRLPAGPVRIGGFGGADGLADWLSEQRVSAVIDATHPFAARISESALAACTRAGVPHLRLERSGWIERPGDRWLRVPDLSSAARLAPTIGQRILLTIGRQDVAVFASVDTAWFLIRCIEAPDERRPPHHELQLARGPFTFDGELALMRSWAIDVLVTRDSGGPATVPKLDAARMLEVPVVMVSRPPAGSTTHVTTVDEALDWLRSIATIG